MYQVSPDTFETLNDLLLPGGRLIAFSETITGDVLVIPKMLARRGFRMDDSIEEHISLHSVFELKSFLMGAAFENVKVFPYDPIRFLFYQKRYFGKLVKIRHPLCFVALFLLLFQNRATEIIFNQFNLFSSKFIPLYTTAGCLLVAEKKTR